jgi:ParB family chromosome partitioning protein
MERTDLPLGILREAAWNPNQLDEKTLEKLKQSINRFGLVENLVVRSKDGYFEVLSGNQRLKVMVELKIQTVPCIVLELNDSEAKLLAQALNHIHGVDDLGLRAQLLREILSQIKQEEVLLVLPESSDNLTSLASIGQEELSVQLQNWQKSRLAKLSHLNFQLTNDQKKVVEEAITRFIPFARGNKSDNPTLRGQALYLLCQSYLGKG